MAGGFHQPRSTRGTTKPVGPAIPFLTVDSVDLRLLLGVADGAACRVLARRLGMSETAVRRRLRRLAAAGSGVLVRQQAAEFHLTERGNGALGAVGRAAAAAALITAGLGVDVVSLRHARVVTVVAGTGSISRAARYLDLPQPSVSALVARIERRWGVTLFTRTPSGVRPTAELVALLPQLRLLDVTSGAGDDLPPPPPCDLVLATETGFPGLLQAIRQVGLDNVRQHVVDIPGPGWTVEMLAADVCVYVDLPLAGITVPAGWETVVAYEDPAYVVMPHAAGHDRAVVSLRELAGYDWLVGQAGTRNHRSVLTLCRAAGFEPRIRFHVLNGPSGGRILEANLVVALTGATMVPRGVAHTVRLAEKAGLRMVVGWRRGDAASGVATWLVRWLRDFHLRRLVERRPELLAEVRADPFHRPDAART